MVWPPPSYLSRTYHSLQFPPCSLGMELPRMPRATLLHLANLPIQMQLKYPPPPDNDSSSHWGLNTPCVPSSGPSPSCIFVASVPIALQRGVLTPIGKRRLREGKTLVQGHTAREELRFKCPKPHPSPPPPILLPSLKCNPPSAQLYQPHGSDFPRHSWFHNPPSLYRLEPLACPRNSNMLAVPHTQGQPRSSVRLRGPVFGLENKTR